MITNTNVSKAIESMKKGETILIYDADDREGETDLAIPAIRMTPKDVTRFRSDGGGLLCVALHPDAAVKFGLPFISDLLRSAGKNGFSPIRKVVEKSGDIPYDKKSSFSLWVNHRNTYTGITDIDRALTINEIGNIVEKARNEETVDFGREFRSPGHVALLRAAEGLLDERRGQTELSIALSILAGTNPAVAICEMLDGSTGKALSKEDAKRYASENGFVFVEGHEIVESFKNHAQDTEQ
ncbi:MAG: 3,4-dihydroxy-2-butanone-4-phosphate synthase [Halobacteriota archaeon]|nr:3,4-dihydroxy-2-butanone-4-phosphate synthase [Halobacteriota archaeon]